jgi:predicted aspartyl protease
MPYETRSLSAAGVILLGAALAGCPSPPTRLSSTAIPLSLADDGHFTVPARVNGSGPFPFILDTGADSGVVYEWFAKQRDLPAEAAQELSGQTGTVSTPMYRIKQLSIGGRSIANTLAYAAPNRHDRGKEAGVAGNDLMDGSVVVFDFPCKAVEFRVKPFSVERLVPKSVPVIEAGTIEDGTLLTLPVQLQNAAGVALLDTGSRDTRISPQFAAAAGIDPSSPAFRDGDLIYGANSKAATSRIGPVGRVQFAGIAIANVEARVIDLAAFRSAGVGGSVMLLGTDLMQGYRLVYDHAAKQLGFSPSACASSSIGH